MGEFLANKLVVVVEIVIGGRRSTWYWLLLKDCYCYWYWYYKLVVVERLLLLLVLVLQIGCC